MKSSPKAKIALLITCEHSTYFIPPEFKRLFRGEEKLLRSHRGWDEGARGIAEHLGLAFKAPLILGKHSRLLADLNRTADNNGVFSEWTRNLSENEKTSILRHHHLPHWEKVRSAVQKLSERGRYVLHIGVHSFVPVLHGHERSTDIGLLYDPARKLEDKLCRSLQKTLRRDTDLAIHRNLPYRGTGNGLVMALRKEFAASKYVGVELEVNQRCFRAKGVSAKATQALIEAIRKEIK
ncbi:MAG: N-formylglutamate amidohydrolase [Bdellovibrionota bacterium]